MDGVVDELSIEAAEEVEADEAEYADDVTADEEEEADEDG